MSLPTSFFIGRGGASISIYRVLMIGGGGAATSNSWSTTGGPAGLAVFDIELSSGTSVTMTAGGGGNSTNKFGGGGGHSRLQIPSKSFDAVVGGGGGAAYVDMGGYGGGLNINGTHGYDYPGSSITLSGQIKEDGGYYGSGRGGYTAPGGGGSGGAAGQRSGSQGVAGGSFYGGVFAYPGDSYPGGGGGSGYYGGGSGSGNNGMGGGPGGGGSGYLSVGNVPYTELLNAAHQTLNVNLFSTDPGYHASRNESMTVQYGNIDFAFPHDYFTTPYSTNSHAISHWHDQLSTVEPAFSGYRKRGGGGRYTTGAYDGNTGVIVILKDGIQVASVSGGMNTSSSSNNGNTTSTVTLS
jgi:hypothetical protein